MAGAGRSGIDRLIVDLELMRKKPTLVVRVLPGEAEARAGVAGGGRRQASRLSSSAYGSNWCHRDSGSRRGRSGQRGPRPSPRFAGAFGMVSSMKLFHEPHSLHRPIQPGELQPQDWHVYRSLTFFVFTGNLNHHILMVFRAHFASQNIKYHLKSQE